MQDRSRSARRAWKERRRESGNQRELEERLRLRRTGNEAGRQVGRASESAFAGEVEVDE